MSSANDQFSFPGFEPAPAVVSRVKPPQTQKRRHSLFFAIRPWWDDLLRVEAEAAELRQRFGVRKAVEAEQLHVTCGDLGDFEQAPSAELIEKARRVAATVALPPFEAVFESVTRFNNGGALVLTEAAGATPLTAFRDALDHALVQAGVPVKFQSRLHMTLGYGDGAVSEALPRPLRWKAQQFLLLDSHIGQRHHEELGCWPLLPQA